MKAQAAHDKLVELERNVAQIIRGKDDVVRLAIVGLLAHGHILLEDVPGVGKTTLAHCLALSVGLTFQRIQFTSDLLPSDVLGVTVYDPERREFEFRPGPIFANVILADELNRTTPKTQSALLEAMNSAEVSIERTTHALPQPFIVLATQNPIESHGTFPLPQSQLDRFLMRLHMGYPDAQEERAILRDLRDLSDFSRIGAVVDRTELMAMQQAARTVKVEDSLIDYIVRFAQATREHPGIEIGVSPRGALALRRCAQARAYLEGRDFCIPDDIKMMAVPALAHRVIPIETFENGSGPRATSESIIRALLDQIEVPV